MGHLEEFIINHWELVIAFVVLAALLILDFSKETFSSVKRLNVHQAVQQVNNNKGLFVDVRETNEFKTGHIAESLNIPVSKLKDNLVKLKNKTQPIVLVCASGQRAQTAAKQLKDEGYEQVLILSGGIQAWKEAKLPLFSI